MRKKLTEEEKEDRRREREREATRKWLIENYGFVAASVSVSIKEDEMTIVTTKVDEHGGVRRTVEIEKVTA